MRHDDGRDGDLMPVGQRAQRHFAGPGAFFERLLEDFLLHQPALHPLWDGGEDFHLADIGVGIKTQELPSGGIEVQDGAIRGGVGDHIRAAFQNGEQPIAFCVGFFLGGDVFNGAHAGHAPVVIDQADAHVNQHPFAAVFVHHVEGVFAGDGLASLAAAVVIDHTGEVFWGHDFGKILLQQLFGRVADHGGKGLVNEAQFGVLDHEQTVLHVCEQIAVTFF